MLVYLHSAAKQLLTNKMKLIKFINQKTLSLFFLLEMTPKKYESPNPSAFFTITHTLTQHDFVLYCTNVF